MLTQHYSPKQFALFRIVFGLYIANHFREIFPYASDLYSATGMLPDPRANLTYWIAPDPLYLFDSATAVQSVCGAGIFFSLLFASGIMRRTSALILWAIWAMLFNRNVLTLNPSVPFIGFLLLACVIVPKGESLFQETESTRSWEMPRNLLFVVWLVMATSYSMSGVLKLSATSWLDGSAVLLSIDQIHARDTWFRDALIAAPTWLIHTLTWLTLAGEILFLFLLPFRFGRAVCWFTMTGMHIALLFLLTFYDLSLGMLMIHLFTFDTAWIPGNKRETSRRN